MKHNTATTTTLCGATATLLLGLSAAQCQVTPAERPRGDWSGWSVTHRDETSTTYEFTEPVASSTNDNVSATVRRITHVGSGLNYVDSNGDWKESIDLIEMASDGRAAALHGPGRAYFKPDLTADAAITLVKGDLVFETRPIGVYYFDPLTGRTVVLAEVSDSAVAELHPPNQIVWKNAFDSEAIKADLRITYTKFAFESDVIITHQPRDPSMFGFDPATTQIQVHHAWSKAPTPQRTIKVLGPNLTDEILDFGGGIQFPTGRAFHWDGSGGSEPGRPAVLIPPGVVDDGNGVGVGKTWQVSGNGAILTESVSWAGVAEMLSRLPEIDGAPPTVSSPKRIEVVTAPYDSPGVVIDYYITVSSGVNYDFMGGTYLIDSCAQFTGLVQFYPTAVIKYSQDNNGYLWLTGPNASVNCLGGTILTSVNENIFGEVIPGSTGTPGYSAYRMLQFDSAVTTPQTIQGMRFRWAQVGFKATGNGAITHSILTSSFEWCDLGIYLSYCNLSFVGSQNKYCSVDPSLTGLTGTWSTSGSFSDFCPGDSDGNGMVDSEEFKYFGQLGTLQGHVIGQLNNRVKDKNPPISYQDIYIQPEGTPPGYTDPNINLQPECWLAELDELSPVTGLSSFSPWHDWPLPTPPEHPIWGQGGGTLITRRHFITSDHMKGSFFQPGHELLKFVDVNGDAHEARCLNYETTDEGDICVIVLDRDMPASVQHAQVLPSTVLSKLSPAWGTVIGSKAANLPIVACNQYKEAYISDAFKLELPPYTDVFPYMYGMFTQHSLWFPSWGSKYYTHPQFYRDQIEGDGGSPTYLLINNHLVLMGDWYGYITIPGGYSGCSRWLGPVVDQVNDAIQSLDSWVTATYGTNAITGYSVTLFDLSAFPDLR